MKRRNVAGSMGAVPVLSGLAVTISLLATGCTHVAGQRAKIHSELDEHSRALTTAVVDTLQLQPAEQHDAYTEFALKVAREDQRIEGLPLDPIAVEPFLHTDATNALPKIKAERALAARFTEIEQLLAKEKKQSERLLEFGETYEQERNRSRARWAKWITSASVMVGGAIALCVFVPAAIPIFGRILGWLVSKIPALAGAVGVVSVKAFDAVVKGIERTKSEADKSSSLANDSQSAGAGCWTGQLDLNLSREMDAAHKALVRERKAALGGIQ